MNCFKIKTQGGFNLVILKVKQIYYKRIKVFTIRFNPKSIATSNSNLLTRPHASSESTDFFSSQFYSNTNTHACDFEIPLKSFRSPSIVDFCSSNQVLPPLDCRSCSGRFLCSQKVQNLSDLTKRVTHKSSKSLKNVARVSLLYVDKLD